MREQYGVWRRTSDGEGSLGRFPHKGDENSNWHTLSLEYDSKEGLILAKIDQEALPFISNFRPNEIQIFLSLKKMPGLSTNSRVEFDNFRLRLGKEALAH